MQTHMKTATIKNYVNVDKENTMKLVGFTKQVNGTYKEYLPYNEQLTSDKQKRVIFFNMFNMYIDKDLQFSKKEMRQNCTIEETFERKIISSIDISCIKTFTPYSGANIKIDITSSLLIFAYFTHRPISFPLKNKPLLPIGKLINLIYTPKGLSLLLDLDDMFLHLVYERIKKVNRYADVLLYEKSIVIKDKREGVADTLVIPSYRKLDKDHLYEDIDFITQMNGVEKTLKEGDISQIFLVYPKHPNFEKHINIKLPFQAKLSEDEYKVKVMPYSFSFCAKETRKKGLMQKGLSKKRIVA